MKYGAKCLNDKMRKITKFCSEQAELFLPGAYAVRYHSKLCYRGYMCSRFTFFALKWTTRSFLFFSLKLQHVKHVEHKLPHNSLLSATNTLSMYVEMWRKIFCHISPRRLSGGRKSGQYVNWYYGILCNIALDAFAIHTRTELGDEDVHKNIIIKLFYSNSPFRLVWGWNVNIA